MEQLLVLKDLAVIFAVSLLVILVFHQVKLPALPGFIVAGVLLGPNALGLVSDVHRVEGLAEVGVVLPSNTSVAAVLRFWHVHTSHVTHVTRHGRPAPGLEPRPRPNRYRKCRKTGHFLASVRSLLLLTYCSKRH